jgi:hypothetical protein
MEQQRPQTGEAENDPYCSKHLNKRYYVVKKKKKKVHLNGIN